MQRAWKKNLLLLLVIGGLSSCAQTGLAPSPTATPTPLATAALQPTPQISADPGLFAAVTDRYEAEVVEGQNGYPLLKPILNSELPEGLGDDLEMVSVDSPEQIKGFDTLLLPTLQEGFSKDVFVPPGRLEAGSGDINYRGLRHLVALVVQRAEQQQEEKNLESALELVQLPLALADAMQSRPETVSVNLFSGGYASSALDWIQTSLESGELDQDTIGKLQQVLSEYSPSYSHVEESITVDFAQLTNSLATEEGRQMMGIGQVQDSTLETWNQQLGEIYQEATQLYQTEQLDPDAFNRIVLEASGPIQGLVIDYPAMATMQKRYFAEYKATELGLALVGPDAPKWKDLDTDELLESYFKEEPETVEALSDLLKIERDEEGAVTIKGQMEQFELLAPGVEPILFEHRPIAENE